MNEIEFFQETLEPCPFCGEDLIVIQPMGTRTNCYAECPECMATAGLGSDPEQAAKNWNRRVDPWRVTNSGHRPVGKVGRKILAKYINKEGVVLWIGVLHWHESFGGHWREENGEAARYFTHWMPIPGGDA